MKVQTSRRRFIAGIVTLVALAALPFKLLARATKAFEAEDADSKTRALGLSQTLDWGGKRRARLTVAEAERRSVEADVSSVRWQVAVELLSALADYQTGSEVNALAAIRVATMHDFAAVSRRRYDAGDISQIELDLAVLAYTQARMQLATAAAAFAESKQAVTNLVFNIPETKWPGIDAELVPPKAGLDSAADLVMTLPHVRAAQLRAEAASARVSLRERERRVDPTLTLRGGKEDDDIARFSRQVTGKEDSTHANGAAHPDGQSDQC